MDDIGMNRKKKKPILHVEAIFSTKGLDQT